METFTTVALFVGIPISIVILIATQLILKFKLNWLGIKTHRQIMEEVTAMPYKNFTPDELLATARSFADQIEMGLISDSTTAIEQYRELVGAQWIDINYSGAFIVAYYSREARIYDEQVREYVDQYILECSIAGTEVNPTYIENPFRRELDNFMKECPDTEFEISIHPAGKSSEKSIG